MTYWIFYIPRKLIPNKNVYLLYKRGNGRKITDFDWRLF